MEPDFDVALIQLAELYVSTDRFDEAVQMWERLYRVWRLDELAERLGSRYTTEGPPGFWRTLLETPAPYEPDDFYRAYLLGGLGDVDQAFASLDLALEKQINGTTFLGTWPSWDLLADDPRFAEAVSRIGRPPIPSN
jgi:tetratricopeptide (TPR) repeat protein